MWEVHEFHEKFADPVRAASYVGSGLLRAFPNGVVEVVLHSPARERRWVGRADEAGHIIEMFCRRFPRPVVYYHPENPDGNVAEIECHCGHKSHATCCKRRGDRPKVVIRVTRDSAVHQSAQAAVSDGS